MEGTSEGEMAAGSRARGGAVERTVLAARTGTRGESAGLSLSMRCVAAGREREGERCGGGGRARLGGLGGLGLRGRPAGL